ncbi:glucan biosynthesis protein [Afifella marina]|uniref:Glucans biosynthesis protein n=1 Tax=Afifella marina DSM 2698 TaxID=1120955 RepID=A0A1G5N502_AFIMA|nr:glucan biosynthesis protein G [Afifella marina]MBK1622373.1 hypothetical protein [Afifella marina DSM 2698]MBK1626913.1 hypothetical protein [Afifella marina]MBK5919157.1 hypothetical protein [Afifella marina]RAI21207.1 hypothetical protein CH311_06915 [Afifella marina DSM 2698]SCZ31740.1 glucans biosynthesis protein [Afifella marina DSM 2698]
MDRRAFLVASLAAAASSASGTAFAQRGASSDTPENPAPDIAAPPPNNNAFTWDGLKSQARALAERPFKEADDDLPAQYADLNYAQFREIEYRREARLWRDEGLAFQLDFLHRGALFKERVNIFIVENGEAHNVAYNPAMYNFRQAPQPPEGVDIGFSGFRVHNPINSPNVWDEFLVFQGATYFRAVGQGQYYGLSARGLALKTGDPEGEEFPRFTTFWIEKPEAGEEVLNIYALLDSVSTTGAYRFVVRPGRDTVIEVTGELFPRQPLQHVGLAPLTSMFLFGPLNRTGFNDYRPQVHDSDGLQMLTGNNEWIWRPLANYPTLQSSSFMDPAPRGFGLVQRARDFQDFQDLEARYERRPSVWIEPIGTWANGQVELLEIPTDKEIHDNIVTFWRPSYEVSPGAPYSFAYRMRWTDRPKAPAGSLYAADSRAGRNFHDTSNLYVIDFIPEEGTLPAFDGLSLEVSANHGAIKGQVLQPNPLVGGVRATFLFEPEDQLTEFRVRLVANGEPASETWLYRWVPQ